MLVPQNLREKYPGPRYDADTESFFEMFDEAHGDRVLEVGANEEYAANILADLGYDVVGVDLREYGHNVPAPVDCNYLFMRSDVMDLPPEMHESFHSAFSLSAVEHFGFGTYGEGHLNYALDVLAMHKIWQLLIDGGTCYITVPYGREHQDNVPHWRIYNRRSIEERIVQDFSLEDQWFFVSGTIDGHRYLKPGDKVEEAFADSYHGKPHLTTIVKLRKQAFKRLSPDGR